MKRKKYFKVLEEVSYQIQTNKITKHAYERLIRIHNINLENNPIINSFVVDKKHSNGNEVHVILEDATILIFNQNTNKFITVLFARPHQIKRYYEQLNLDVPQKVYDNAYTNYCLNRNNI